MKGRLSRIMGPLVEARDMRGSRMYDVVLVGEERLMGEIIRINQDRCSIQVYEDTTGLKPSEPVVNTGNPLSVELGPGILTSIYDGIQRPLAALKDQSGDFIGRGLEAHPLSRKKTWDFTPTVKKGDQINASQIIGTLPETEIIEHKVLLPPLVSGKIAEIKAGSYTVEDTIGTLSDGTELKLMHNWPVKTPRPYLKKHSPTEPLITGERVIDVFFPIAKGGTAAIPGPFGAGKTVVQHQLAKWTDADVIVYVGCGERGNEMTEVLDEFPNLLDPKSGKSLMERTTLIANTSNMPVAAREASVYTGITLAEYYRDMGFNAALMADSTSRWAEAMREISARLEEMPGEEGYPAYLGSKLATFYERAGKVDTLSGLKASASIIGAVSPPGGDLSEPVTQNTLRIVRVFWSLDARLADRRHFPSINWLRSYSLYRELLEPWIKENIAENMPELRDEAMSILQRESELLEIVQLVGADALPDNDRMLMETAKMLREDFLQQDAYHEVDTYCPLPKQHMMLTVILQHQKAAVEALERGEQLEKVLESPFVETISKMKYMPTEKFMKDAPKLLKDIEEEWR